MGCVLKTSDTTPRISWTHSDPEADAQTGYQVQIDRALTFDSNSGSPDYDSGGVTSVNQYHDVSPALTVSGKLYVRVRTRDSVHAIGEGAWSSGDYIILDPAIDTVAATPILYFTIPLDPDNDNLHFRVQIDITGDFTIPLLSRYSGDSQIGWEYWNGSTWAVFPAGGVISTYYGNQCRYIVQAGESLTQQGINAFRVRAEEVASEVSDYAYALMDVIINQPPTAPSNIIIESA